MVPDTICRHWILERDADGLAWLTLDRAESSANSLSSAVLDELEQLLADVARDLPQAVIIRSGKPSGFIAGADVKEFTTLTDRDQALTLIRRGQGILTRIEALPVPTVALIHGFCLGGGLELVLACRIRIASDDPATRLGLPEVMLGIHPGFGGTVRLIGLVGPLKGLELMLTGRALAARAARAIGLVDAVVPERHLDNAARALAAQPPKRKALPLRERLAGFPLARGLIAGQLRRMTAKKADPRHYPAPYALIDLWQRFGSNASANYAAEAASVAALITGPTSRNLVRVFTLQERLKGTGRLETPAPRTVHVIGGGTMGGDIAIWCALQGMHVTIQDLDTARLGQVVSRGQALFAKTLKERRLIEAASDRLVPDPEGNGVARADLVIEAIFENVAAKSALYRQVEPRLRPEALLATNTSSIPLEELAASLQHPERLIGLHFFNPVEKMQLVEVVTAAQTDPEIARRGAAFVLGIKRLPLPVTSSPGFLVNRILMPYLLEAVTLAEEGMPPAVIDRAATDFGMPMGPLRLADTVGLDICLSVAQILSRHFPVEVPPSLEKMVAAGCLGRKSGQGFYRHGPGAGKPPAKPTAIPSEITSRLMLRLLNEAVACWREQVAADADLLDAGVIFGTGFAPFRGGPLQHVAATGSAALLAELEALAGRHGSRFQPDPGWRQLVADEGGRP